MKLSLKPEIIFEDQHLIVVSKPAGLLSQGEETDAPNLVDWLRGYLGRHYVGLVHRLDRNTSGLMVVAKRTKSAARLTASLQEGALVRHYLAWLVGDLKAPAAWKHHLLKDEKKNEVRVVSAKTGGAKPAHLSMTPRRRASWKNRTLTLAELKLETGRSHQIRVQAAAEGFPVLGDRKYGQYCREAWNLALERPALHSSFLSFPHPMSGEVMKFESPLPPDLDF
ncbi:MAG TPA: RluA family pseudouridine synthase [Verrucomicrobiae bacterium]|jgi:23S rRNA pseudouridine1911/1915/1917 synthase|nr:RluA family pseudouridine synthase [Verrucomicrobiae bacterium]